AAQTKFQTGLGVAVPVVLTLLFMVGAKEGTAVWWIPIIGAAIIGALSDSDTGRRTAVLGLPTAFIPQGSPAEILHRLGLDAGGVATTCLSLID
ncbi:MAG: hypothetical protein ACO3VH_05675, partial [Ilumatobacteraceae bacterium]